MRRAGTKEFRFGTNKAGKRADTYNVSSERTSSFLDSIRVSGNSFQERVSDETINTF